MKTYKKLLGFLKELEEKYPLPIQSTIENQDFEERLTSKLKEFSSLCRNHEIFDDLKPDDKLLFYSISDKIQQCLTEYLWGSTVHAQRVFHKLMKKCLGLFNRKVTSDKPLVLFRLRKNEQYPFEEKKKIFHVPFDKRRSVSSSRYSIPGSPSLYLSDSVELCFEELREPTDTIYDYSVSIFYTSDIVRLIELITPSDFLRKDGSDECDIADMYKIIAVFPLVLACSFRTLPPHDHPFKPEYVIPQMLMDFVRNSGEVIHGIKYRSTKLNFISGKTESSYNYVFPVPANDPIDKDYQSMSLKKLFDWSPPVKISDILANYETIEKTLVQENQGLFNETEEKLRKTSLTIKEAL